jgi:serine/threonine protein kinase
VRSISSSAVWVYSDPVVSDSERLPPGQLIADRYRVGEFVGRGAMGIVYAGEHVRVGRRVAIKVLTTAWSKQAIIRQRFEAEARAASAAGHPNVIQVLDIGELPDGRLYSVMEFVDGCDLNTLLWAEGPLALDRACRLVRDAAFGVRAAHARGVIHRDLKLENVMVQSLPEGEVVKVLDFGVAAEVVMNQRATAPGVVLGTPEYMAPADFFVLDDAGVFRSALVPEVEVFESTVVDGLALHVEWLWSRPAGIDIEAELVRGLDD